MKTIKIYQVDAFTDKLFAGNPAAVCIIDSWISDALMQSVANENNLAETAFVVSNEHGFEIRWFTPTVEVDLCGHATLAAAFVLFNLLNHNLPVIQFYSPRSGTLLVEKQNELFMLDFPSDELLSITESQKSEIEHCIGTKPLEVYKGKTDYVAVVENENVVKNIQPDLGAIAKLNARGLIITAKGNNVDYVLRFFAPQSGINEDPVTGSAQTSLLPLWSAKHGKTVLTAQQLSQRGGQLICKYKNNRCLIGGNARLYLTGIINLE